MFSDSHISITATNDIHEICQPLFKSSPITLFEFTRVFPDGSYIILGSNGKFVKKLSAVKWSSKDLELIKTHFEPSKRYYLLNTYTRHPACMLPIAEEFNTDHGLLIRETYKSHQDNFRFTTQSKKADIYDFCFNNIDFVETFIFYFKDKASPIIKQATMAQRIYLPEPEAYLIENMLSLPDAKVLSENLKVSKYIFTLSERLISLSAQELKSVKLLAMGFTIKEAAQQLNISPRTIESYLKCTREKLKVKTNRQLIPIYWESLNLA